MDADCALMVADLKRARYHAETRLAKAGLTPEIRQTLAGLIQQIEALLPCGYQVGREIKAVEAAKEAA